MHELYELKDKLMRELEQYGKKDMTAGTLEVVDKLSHAIKNICKIMESADDEGYSQRSGRYSYNMRDGGNSYARGRGRNARRDTMGRYSRADGVDELVESVRGMMDDLPEHLKQDAQRFVRKLEQEM